MAEMRQGAIIMPENPPPGLYLSIKDENLKEQHQHYFLVLIDAPTVSSLADGHSHGLTILDMSAAMPTSLEMPMMEPMESMGVLVQVEPAEDGHTHVIDFDRGALIDDKLFHVKQSKKAEEESVERVFDLLATAAEIEKTSRTKGKESYDFYKGDQWPDDIKSALEAQKRPALVINMVQPKIDQLCGTQRQNRLSAHLVPVEDGDGTVADILNVEFRRIDAQCSADHATSLAFKDAVITGRGVRKIEIDYSRDLIGSIVKSHIPWDGVYFGPHLRYDLEDCEYAVESRWVSIAQAKAEYPEYEKEIGDVVDDKDPSSTTYQRSPSHMMYKDDSKGTTISRKSFLDNSDKTIRLLCCYEKNSRASHVVFVPGQFYQRVDGLTRSKINKIAEIDSRLQIVPIRLHKVRKTETCGPILLYDDYVDLPNNELPFVTNYAYKEGNDFWGKIEATKDPQREINKRHSQAVDAANRAITDHWQYDGTTFTSDEDMLNFIQNVNTPGAIMKVDNTAKPPVKVEGGRFPVELVRLIELESGFLHSIMNIMPQMADAPNTQSMSGVALATWQRQSLAGNEFLFDNLAFSERRMARLVLAYIQKHYDPQRLLRTITTMSKPQTRQEDQTLPSVNGKPIDQINPDDIMAIGRILKDADLGKYDVEISESRTTPTARIANLGILMDMARSGVPVPPQALLESTDMPNKKRWMQMIEEQQKSTQDLENKKMDTEVIKTAMANNKGGAAE